MTAAAVIPYEVPSTKSLHIPSIEILSRDFERESRKLIFEELHCRILAEYHRMNYIPHALRSHLHPTLFMEDETYCEQFANILNKCSFDLIALTIDYLEKSMKETKEKISTLELQLTSFLTEDEWTTLKTQMDKVLAGFRKETEIKEGEKFIRDTNDYQLKRVYWWQEPPSYDFGTPTSVRLFPQDESHSSESQCDSNSQSPCPVRDQEMSPPFESPPTKNLMCRSRLNPHPQSLSDLNCLEQTTESFKNKLRSAGLTAGVVTKKSKSQNSECQEKGLKSKGKGLSHKVSLKLRECNKCRKKFPVVVLKTRRRHKAGVGRSVHSRVTEQSNICTECKKMTQDKRLSSAKKAYSCTQCGKRFLQRALLDLHQKSHVEEKLFVCALCGKRFVQHSLLVLHEKTHADNKPYQCMDCGNLFFSKPLFAEHLRTHKKIKPHRCSNCGKCFADKATLIIHQRTHTGEKPFSCNECGKSFSQHSTLVSHQRIHTGEKPYECPVCKRRFADRSALANHHRIHNGEKPYGCQECGKRFTQSCNLRRHERIHMGLKPYMCNKCGKAFSESMKLKYHENIHLMTESRDTERRK